MVEPRGCLWAAIARTPRLASAVTPALSSPRLPNARMLLHGYCQRTLSSSQWSVRRCATVLGTRAAWVVTRRNYPMSESEASAQITGISGGFIGTLRLSERTGKNRMVCTITMAGVKELESRELL